MTIVFIVSAPSGSGKSTLVNELFKMVQGLDFSVSYTTRPARGSEQNGKEYFFVSEAEFEAMITADEFLEYARVFGNYYGTARKFLRESQKHGRRPVARYRCARSGPGEREDSPMRLASSFFHLTGTNWSGDCETGVSIQSRSFVAGWTRPGERLRITRNTTIY